MAGVLENARCGPLFRGDNENEHEYGVVQAIYKFLVVADNMAGVALYETVHVGVDKLVGEVVLLDGDKATIQLYEDSLGDTVERTHAALSAELGPGIVSLIFDGMQRPLEEMGAGGSIYYEKGANTPALNRSKLWEFAPQNFKIGDHIAGGDIFGRVVETSLVTHLIMLPPTAKGTILYIAPHGHYAITEEVLAIEFMGVEQPFTMMHKWPVRQPRPFDEKLPCDAPLLTGVRVYDALFPLAIGGTCAFPGAFGCSKGHTTQALIKHSNSDVVVYVGCGERGNEMCEVLMELPEITMRIGGVERSVMERTSAIGNTTNMPVISREASIYTGMTMVEYFRDQGYNALMIADSTSRWVEALKEISHVMPQVPGCSYPAYLESRLANFYDRAGKVACIGGPARTGAVSLVSSVSPPAGDFGEPFAAATLNICKAFWALDKRIAQRKHFPSVNWMRSYSHYVSTLAPYYENIDPDYSTDLAKIKEILQHEDDLTDIIRTVGRDSLPDVDKLTIEIARLTREEFLQQNAFTPYDKASPPHKTVWMLKNIATFYTLARKAVERDNVKFAKIKTMRDILDELTRMKYQDPADGVAVVEQYMRGLHHDICRSFCLLNDE